MSTESAAENNNMELKKLAKKLVAVNEQRESPRQEAASTEDES